MMKFVSKKVIAITGASGFVGRNLVAFLNDFRLLEINLRVNPFFNKFTNAQTIIHLAGKAHDLKKVASPEEYYQVNFELTKRLYDAFLKSSATKFIFISSVKAVADVVEGVLTEETIPNPQTHYGKSKLMAEAYVQSQPLPEGKSYYILRPCMIHGPGNKGNLNLLYQFVKRGIPYPLAAFENRRSYLSVENLCFVIKKIVEKNISSGVYNVADDDSLSTNEVVEILAASADKKAKLWAVSSNLIKVIAKMGDRFKLPLNSERLKKLTEDYVVSNGKIKLSLGEQLPMTAKKGLFVTASSFTENEQYLTVPIKNEHGKSCLVTGGNGYLGKHVVKHLCELGWNVKTLGKRLNNTYAADLAVDDISFNESFEVVIHCAGKVHSFPKSVKEEQAFYEVNEHGTLRLLNALEIAPSLPKTFVFMSSVSVYGLKKGYEVNEETPLNANQPYGKSKIAAEKIIIDWCEKHEVICLIFRLPLLAGINPPGNLAAMIHAIKNRYYFNVVDEVQKSIVMVDDVAKIIPSAISIGGTYNLTDGDHPSIKQLADLISTQLRQTKSKTAPFLVRKSLLFLANQFSFLAKVDSYKLKKLTNTLTFDDEKARRLIGWKPHKVLEKFFIK